MTIFLDMLKVRAVIETEDSNYLVEKGRCNHLGVWEKDIFQVNSRKQDRQTLSKTNVYHHCIQMGRKYHDRDRHVQ